MGRFIEDAIISYVEEDLKNNGFKVIRAHYYPTKKNIPVKDLFERLGYDIVNIHDNKDYELQLNSYISNNKRKNTASIIEC
jgi:predicted enzyme involved in methoxymalonyl-ACP biosynthesis